MRADASRTAICPPQKMRGCLFSRHVARRCVRPRPLPLWTQRTPPDLLFRHRRLPTGLLHDSPLSCRAVRTFSCLCVMKKGETHPLKGKSPLRGFFDGTSVLPAFSLPMNRQSRHVRALRLSFAAGNVVSAAAKGVSFSSQVLYCTGACTCHGKKDRAAFRTGTPCRIGRRPDRKRAVFPGAGLRTCRFPARKRAGNSPSAYGRALRARRAG